MGDPQGDLRPGTPILVGFFTEISKKWVLDSKTSLVEPPTGGGWDFSRSIDDTLHYATFETNEPMNDFNKLSSSHTQKRMKATKRRKGHWKKKMQNKSDLTQQDHESARDRLHPNWTFSSRNVVGREKGNWANMNK